MINALAPIHRLSLKNLLVAAIAGVTILAAGLSTARAAPSADLWPRWQTHDASSSQTIDHSQWSRLLADHARQSDDGIVRVDYGRFAETGQQALQSYIDRLTSSTGSALNRDEQLAFWINLYNAVTVDLIVENYPVSSILKINISPGFFSIGPWDKKLVTVEGEDLSLNDIEHRILRPIWRDPRIHYAVNCASLGCPNLALEAYTADNVERLLDANAVTYVNHPRGARVDNGRLIVSSIYRWFVADFGGGDAGVLKHLRQYARDDLAEKIHRNGFIDGDDYDWSINDLDPQ
ncbi:MAG: DUF547 domain-containing protein [Alphaproteobacteria bacterium]|nr:DUF547 domain-containing protein [Alphaproteobacteria bacterium]